MTLTHKLLGYLHRAFRRDPVEFLALRLRYDGAMLWKVEDCVLTTSVTGGSGSPLSIDLNQYSIAELANYLSAQPGYSVVYQVSTDASVLGARILLDGNGDQDASNGDHLYAFTSLTWAFLDTSAVELKAAREQIYQMLRQMTAVTAEGAWLDEIGGYYGVPRANGELDSVYGPRIVYEVVRPRNNNKALELAISIATGGLPSKVVDVTVNGSMTPLFDGAIDFDGAYTYSASGSRVRNLFDVEYAFDLEGSEDTAPFRARVLELIDRFRSAGTHLRSVLLTASQLSDSVAGSSDSAAYSASYTATDAATMPVDGTLESSGTLVIAESATGGTDGVLSLGEMSSHLYDGSHLFGGSARQLRYNSGVAELEVAPSLDLNFIDQQFSHALTFTRATTGTYFDAAGVMQTAAINAPRFDYDPLTLQPLGLLIEEARTNLLTQSEFANGVSDAPTRAGLVTASAFSGLTGSTGLAIGYDGVTSTYAYKDFSAADGKVYSLSVFVRMDDGGVPVPYTSGSTTVPAVDFVLICQGLTPTATAVKDLGGGLYRITATRTASGAVANWGIIKYGTNSARTFKVSGYQLEEGPSASSYIPTTGAAVLRSADVCSLAVGSWYTGPAEGTLVADGEGRNGVAVSGTLASLTNDNAFYEAMLHQSGGSRIAQSRPPASGAGVSSAVACAQGQSGTTALGYAVNYSCQATNGVLGPVDTLSVEASPATILGVGCLGTSGYYLNGHVRSIKYWNTRLANELLQLLSM